MMKFCHLQNEITQYLKIVLLKIALKQNEFYTIGKGIITSFHKQNFDVICNVIQEKSMKEDR